MIARQKAVVSAGRNPAALFLAARAVGVRRVAIIQGMFTQVGWELTQPEGDKVTWNAGTNEFQQPHRMLQVLGRICAEYQEEDAKDC